MILHVQILKGLNPQILYLQISKDLEGDAWEGRLNKGTCRLVERRTLRLQTSLVNLLRQHYPKGVAGRLRVLRIF